MIRATRSGFKDVCGESAVGRLGKTVSATATLIMVAAAMPAHAAHSAHQARSTVRPPNKPWTVLPLDSLGVPAMPQAFLDAGMSLMTVNVVDDTHLMLTFETRDLIPRIAGDPPDHEDRMVAAEILDLPSGTVEAHTRWHMHDHAQYLWRLGAGRFLVRSGNSVFAIAPRANLGSDPFQRIAFPSADGHLVSEYTAPDDSLVMLETLSPEDQKAAALLVGDDGERAQPMVDIGFFRMEGGDKPGAGLVVNPAGEVRAPGLLMLGMDGDGYLYPEEKGRDHWMVSFNDYGGKERTIGQVDSSCEPRLRMVSRFEFLAFACQGSDDRMKMELFGMDGHETWEEPISWARFPVFTYAPAAGRFAMSRIVSGFGAADMQSLPSDAEQEVRVYQTESGDLLLKVQSSPVLRDAANFDLSEDGLLAAVIHDGAIEVYKLPPPSARDLADLKEAASFAPQPGSYGPVLLTKLTTPKREPKPETTETASSHASAMGGNGLSVGGARTETGPAANQKLETHVSNSASPNSPALVQSVPETTQPVESTRKPPTLLLPGEKAEFGGPGAETPQ